MAAEKKPASDSPRCVLFTHFMPGKLSALSRAGAQKLQAEWRERFERSWACRSQVDRAFVFVAEGYQALLAVRSFGTPEPPFIGLRTDRELIAIARRAAREAGCAPGFIVPIGFDSLVDTLSRLQRRAQDFEQSLSFLLLGSGEHMRYDSPKVVDAILRIAGRSTGCPVFRIDDDVVPSEPALRKLLEAYSRMQDPESIFVFSGRLPVNGTGTPSGRTPCGNNFAVRTFHLGRKDGSGAFLLNTGDCERFLRGLGEIGAEQGFDRHGDDPSAQVISGAGYCLSYNAVKKLPPFANMSSAITWIDDHLKRRMHEGLEDLGANAAISRVEGALFRQNRRDHAVKGDGVRGYLNTLARGCIFDALIYDRGPGLYTQCIREYLAGDFDFPRIFEKPPRSVVRAADPASAAPADGMGARARRRRSIRAWHG